MLQTPGTYAPAAPPSALCPGDGWVVDSAMMLTARSYTRTPRGRRARRPGHRAALLVRYAPAADDVPGGPDPAADSADRVMTGPAAPQRDFSWAVYGSLLVTTLLVVESQATSRRTSSGSRSSSRSASSGSLTPGPRSSGCGVRGPIARRMSAGSSGTRPRSWPRRSPRSPSSCFATRASTGRRGDHAGAHREPGAVVHLGDRGRPGGPRRLARYVRDRRDRFRLGARRGGPQGRGYPLTTSWTTSIHGTTAHRRLTGLSVRAASSVAECRPGSRCSGSEPSWAASSRLRSSAVPCRRPPSTPPARRRP